QYANVPYALTPMREQDGFDAHIVSFPFARCESFFRRKGEFGFQPLRANPGLSNLFGAYFRGFVGQAPHLKGPAAYIAVDTLLHLALLAQGTTSATAEPTRDAIHAGQLEAVRQFIARNLARADLTPAHAAHAVGISVRQLHFLFEPTGTTFTRYL